METRRDQPGKSGKAIMIQGTGSHVGKSIMVAALCRIFLQDGYRVAPFKAQNMALNSFVTRDGGEMGRAQVVQAQACRLEPSVDMNPVLIKPTSDVGAQIIVRGKPIGNMSALQYTDYKRHLIGVITESFARLINEYDLVVVEGAGSPAEVNLRAHDIVNMKMAEIADAPVILVGDIDKGGVFAWLVGTMVLLTEDEQERVKGFIINKFRGDKSLLTSGLEFLEHRTGKRVLGVVPYFKDILIPEEDSVPEFKMKHWAACPAQERLDITVIHLAHISNFTDFDALEAEPDVRLRYLSNGDRIGNPDILIIPGSKNTIWDLERLYSTGWAEQIKEALANGTQVVGICAGYQMLGKKILDPHHIESHRGEVDGLGLLNVITEFHRDKITAQVKARCLRTGVWVSGYEIHHGITRALEDIAHVFEITERSGQPVSANDGALASGGQVWGTNIHGLFDNDSFRREFLNQVRARKGWSPIAGPPAQFDQDQEYDKLAKLVRENIDMDFIYRILREEI
jgi:adenosylcobyric acid synthase